MKNNQPETLQEAIVYFADKQNAFDFVVNMRWPKDVACPHCQSKKLYFVKTRLVWQCKECKKQFSVKTGTIFEDSPLGLDKWLAAIWMIVNAKNGISSYEIHRSIGVTQKTAWFMLHRIRHALKSGSLEKIFGDVEADETYIGGKAKTMHKDKREAKITGRGATGKAIVFGLLERKGQVITRVVKTADKPTLQSEIIKHVEAGSNLYTDQFQSYQGLDAVYVHQVINHAIEYVRDNTHTQGIDNYWSPFKRALRGTYVSCGTNHLFRYLDEENFRFNNRFMNDAQRFNFATLAISGKRLTYKQLLSNPIARQLRLI